MRNNYVEIDEEVKDEEVYGEFPEWLDLLTNEDNDDLNKKGFV